MNNSLSLCSFNVGKWTILSLYVHICPQMNNSLSLRSFMWANERPLSVSLFIMSANEQFPVPMFIWCGQMNDSFSLRSYMSSNEQFPVPTFIYVGKWTPPPLCLSVHLCGQINAPSLSLCSLCRQMNNSLSLCSFNVGKWTILSLYVHICPQMNNSLSLRSFMWANERLRLSVSLFIMSANEQFPVPMFV